MDTDTAHDGPRGRLDLAMEKAWRHEALPDADIEAQFHRNLRGVGVHLAGASLVLGVVMTWLLDLPTTPASIAGIIVDAIGLIGCCASAALAVVLYPILLARLQARLKPAGAGEVAKVAELCRRYPPATDLVFHWMKSTKDLRGFEVDMLAPVFEAIEAIDPAAWQVPETEAARDGLRQVMLSRGKPVG